MSSAKELNSYAVLCRTLSKKLILFSFKKQKTVLDNLEERLEAANKLHGEALDLHTLYESGTVSTMRDLRATGKTIPCYLQMQNKETLSLGIPRPLPQDNPLFSEVDLVLAEIGRFYEELKNFWAGEIRHVVEALKKGRTDARDFERWKNFHSSLKQTIESWKVCLPLHYAFHNQPKYRVQNQPLSGDAHPLRRDITASSFTVRPCPFHFGAHLG